MKQTSLLTKRLTESQENHAKLVKGSLTAVVYCLYTEYKGDLVELVSRYFTGATIYDGLGVWQGATELAAVVEILATAADLQRIVYLAGDIKQVNNQSCVIVTWQPVNRLDV